MEPGIALNVVVPRTGKRSIGKITLGSKKIGAIILF